MKMLDFVQVTGSGEKAVTVQVKDLVIAGWTGRDPEVMEEHMAELEAIGIARPKTSSHLLPGVRRPAYPG